MRKRPRRPRHAARKLVSAAELARRRGVDDRTIRRWVRAGCPVARRGKPGHTAPRFDESKVSTWLAKNDTAERQMVAALVAVTDARARRTRNDLLRLQEQYVDPQAVAAIWPAFVAYVRQRAETLITELPVRLVAVAQNPPPPFESTRTFRVIAADEIRRIIATDAPRPWKEPAEPAIRTFAERGTGIEINVQGHWFPESPLTHAIPMSLERAVADEIKRGVYALLRDLATTQPASSSKPTTTRLLPTLTTSKTLRAARAQLANFQTPMVELRDRVASSALARTADVQHGYMSRVLASRTHFLGMQRLAPQIVRAVVVGVGGDEIRALLIQAVAAALAELTPRHPRKEETA